ncbi:hypothetical protein [Zavarzinia sp.]|uniref:hypothetical protein n=1 Tax=Zavarzinia sp. TaxID=2027920 RepID=UPI003566E13B
MPPNLLILMFQSAFRVTFERESLRLAALFGVAPALAGLAGSMVGAHVAGATDVWIMVWGLGGALVGGLTMVPFAVRAAGDLLARLLDRAPIVTPGRATLRAYRLLGEAAIVMFGFGLIVFAVGQLLPENQAAPYIGLALAVIGLYLALGMTLLPQLAFYEPLPGIRQSFTLMKGERLRVFLFMLLVALPFTAVAGVLDNLAGAQPDSSPLIALAVSLVAGFVNGLSTGPQLVGLTQFYFAKLGEAPPTLRLPEA